MSTYVGWYFGGSVQVFDESSEETTFHKITKVEENLGTLDAVLDELQCIVEVEDVKQLVFVHDGSNTKSCKSIVEKLTEKGLKSVYIQHWISNHFQTFLLKQNVEFVEAQHFLLAIKGDKEVSAVWRYCSERIEFVKFGPIIPPSESNLSSYDRETIRLFNNFEIQLMLNMECVQFCGIVKNLFPECKIVENVAPFTVNDFSATALWTAKRQDDLVDGVEVGNYCWTGLQLRIGAKSIKYETKFIPLPFKWSSEWKHCESASTVFATDEESEWSFKLPANRRFRINVEIDRNGLHEVKIELKCILGISLSQDSFYLVRSSDSLDGKVISIGQFPTAVRFDCDPPKLASSVSVESVIADAIEMLDPDQEENNGWNCLTTFNCSTEFCKNVETETGSRVVTASFVVGELFDHIKSLVADVSLDSEKPICIALSRFHTQKQREKLTNILKLKLPRNYFVDEIKAATFGFSVEKARPDGVTLVVDLRSSGCVFSLFRIEDNCCKLIVQQEFADLKSENVRQAMHILHPSEVFSIKPTSEFKTEMTEIIVKFRQAVSAVVGAEQMNVKSLLLIGSCNLVSKLEDFFAWSFFHADVNFLEESELCQFAATGSVLLNA